MYRKPRTATLLHDIICDAALHRSCLPSHSYIVHHPTNQHAMPNAPRFTEYWAGEVVSSSDGVRKRRRYGRKGGIIVWTGPVQHAAA